MLSNKQKNKEEFLCNECCFFGCNDRKACYENAKCYKWYSELAFYLSFEPVYIQYENIKEGGLMYIHFALLKKYTMI